MLAYNHYRYRECSGINTEHCTTLYPITPPPPHTHIHPRYLMCQYYHHTVIIITESAVRSIQSSIAHRCSLSSTSHQLFITQFIYTVSLPRHLATSASRHNSLYRCLVIAWAYALAKMLCDCDTFLCSIIHVSLQCRGHSKGVVITKQACKQEITTSPGQLVLTFV